MILFRKNTPRWVVFIIDLLISISSITFAYLLRFDFELNIISLQDLYLVYPVFLIVRIISFVLSKSYSGIIRYTSSKDIERITVMLTVGSAFFVFYNFISFYFISGKYLIPVSIIIIDFFVSVFTMIFFRISVKSLYLELNNPTKEKSNVVIYGADEFAVLTKRTFDRDINSKLKVVAFIDNSKRNIGKKLEGVEIFHADDYEFILQKFEASNFVFAQENISTKRKNEITEFAINNQIKVLSIPPVSKWINGELSFNQLKKIKIEDLLEREPIALNIKQIKKELCNKTVLITGAAGSIGSEIVRQVSKFNPSTIILVDQAESPLYDIELEVMEQLKFKNSVVIIGDITNLKQMEIVFKQYKPNIVFHAAAYKHVPMMESNPAIAIRTNVLGTKNIADFASKYNVQKFVMVSTDKAVNPTNVMGASKRLAEIYIQSLNDVSKTNFITTRFGNVLGSNGSVIPRFRKQIEKGGPVTVTHPEITRFFMTIKEACELVLDASAMGNGGEIFIFDMGKSVKIVDLAKKMIRLSGLTLGKDIQLNFTGLRPGEKLYEELLNAEENCIPTHHSEILIAKVQKYDFETSSKQIHDLINLALNSDNFSIVKKMKSIIPEYKSQNSIYEGLD